jgi:hypothetical protein
VAAARTADAAARVRPALATPARSARARILGVTAAAGSRAQAFGAMLVEAGRSSGERCRQAVQAARAADDGTGPGLASLAVGVLSLLAVVVTAYGPSGQPASPPARLPQEGITEINPRLLTVAAALRDPTLAEERAIGMLDEVAADGRDAATEVLIAAADSPSIVLSMASIRSLRGRPCARVAPVLIRQLDQVEWQRRAWAAKVLGENGCVAAMPVLTGHLAREPDPRVWRQLGAALAALDSRRSG